ncbi:MAG TPA: DUF2520 domain-containing protein [Williamwhitmania sp.]|nr:DUF2520 domain-containing protein [Williamwhitmania sp.]
MSKGLNKLSAVFIGAGGLAWSVSHALAHAGLSIRQIISPTPASGLILANELGCTYASSIAQVDLGADIFFIAVPDRAIGRVAEELALQLPDSATVVHSSGSVSITALNLHGNAAIFYPFQTFTRGRVVDLSNVAVFIEASNGHTLALVTALASAVTNQVHSITSEQRLLVHLAGVIGNNFTNFLIGKSGEFLQRQGFSMEILHPLILETVSKAFELSPEKAQTGPAVRNDVVVLEKHQELLHSMPQLQRLYALFSELIALKKAENKTDNDITSHE